MLPRLAGTERSVGSRLCLWTRCVLGGHSVRPTSACHMDWLGPQACWVWAELGGKGRAQMLHVHAASCQAVHTVSRSEALTQLGSICAWRMTAVLMLLTWTERRHRVTCRVTLAFKRAAHGVSLRSRIKIASIEATQKRPSCPRTRVLFRVVCCAPCERQSHALPRP